MNNNTVRRRDRGALPLDQPVLEGLEHRFAARLASALTLRADAASHDVAERLRVAREQALARGRAARAAAPLAVAANGTGLIRMSGTAALLGRAGGPPWWQRAASALPIVLLLVGLAMINQASVRERVLAAAELDSQLLADDLPPDAYSDPGFAEFLRADSPAAP